MIVILSIGLYDMNSGSNTRLHLDIFELTHNATSLDELSQEKFTLMRTDAYDDLQSGAAIFVIGLIGITVLVMLIITLRDKNPNR